MLERFSATCQLLASRRLLSLIAALGLCGGFYFLGQFPSGQDQPSITVLSRDLDFGDAWATPDFHFTIPVKNNNDVAVQISAKLPSCDCATVTPSESLVGPGEITTVHFRLDLLPKKDTEAHGFSRRYELPLFVRACDREGRTIGSANYQILGRIKNAISFPCCRLVFDDTNSVVSGRLATARVVPFRSSIALKAINGRDPQGLVAVNAELSTLTQGELRIAPRGNLPLGPFITTVILDLFPAAPMPSPHPPAYLPIKGAVVHDVEATPDPIVLGPARIGEVICSSVSLRSRTATPFEIRSAALDGGTARLGESGDSVAVSLRYTVAHAGIHNTVLTLTVNQLHAVSTLSIPVVCVGLMTGTVPGNTTQ